MSKPEVPNVAHAQIRHRRALEGPVLLQKLIKILEIELYEFQRKRTND